MPLDMPAKKRGGVTKRGQSTLCCQQYWLPKREKKGEESM